MNTVQISRHGLPQRTLDDIHFLQAHNARIQARPALRDFQTTTDYRTAMQQWQEGIRLRADQVCERAIIHEEQQERWWLKYIIKNEPVRTITEDKWRRAGETRKKRAEENT